MTEEAAIQADELGKTFGEEHAVRDVTFVVPKGAIFGYIGPSGSGKTTTMRLLMGTERPTSGKARVLGRAPSAFGRSTRRRLGYMPQQFVLYPDLSVWENLSFAASIYGIGWGKGKRMRELLDFVDLAEHKHKRARDISGGMQRRLSLAATLVHDPELLFLDEPTAGVDPVLRERFWERFRDLQEQGRTLFVTTQYVAEAAYCDLVGIMSEGRLLMVDTPDALRKRAFGGDQVEVKLKEAFAQGEVWELRSLPFVRRVDQVTDTDVHLVVDEAPSATPALMDWARSRQHTVEAIEEYHVPFEEVFVSLVRNA